MATLLWVSSVGLSPARAETLLAAGRTVGAPGFEATLPVVLTSDTPVAGLQFDFKYDPERLSQVAVQPGEALGTHELRFRQMGPGWIRVLIHTPAEAWLTAGEVASLQFFVAQDAPAGIEFIALSNVIAAADTAAQIHAVEGLDGFLAIFSTEFMHDIEDLSLLLQSDPGAANVTMTATSPTLTVAIFSGPPTGATPRWVTTEVPDGRYQLTTTFTAADGSIRKQFLREVAVNNSVVWHSGFVTENETWSNQRVHVAESSVLVRSNATITIQAGAIVKFTRGSGLSLERNCGLEALGTLAQPIVLTSIADDTVGGDSNLDGSSSLPKPGDWPGISAHATARVSLNEHAELRYVIALHGGEIAQDEVWDGTHLHRLVDHLQVNPGVTLTIQPGAVIKFDPARQLNVRGRVIARGTVPQPITFTSILDDSVGGDTNLDGNRTQPSAGDWAWIHLIGGQGEFAHCIVRYGSGPVAGGWGQKGMFKTSGSATLTIENSYLLDAFYDGVLAWGGGVRIANTVLVGIDRAISAHPGSPVEVVNCSLYNNKIGLLTHGGSLAVDNTIVANSILSGYQHDFGTLVRLRYCNIWAPPFSGSVNYRNAADRTGQNGNLSIDPRFKDADRLNFRLTFGSPCIDAADGTVAPPRDLLNVERFTDLRSVPKGVLAANGAYPDMGAFEFAEAAPSDVDLLVREVRGPANVVAGQVADIEWLVVNAGTGVVNGPWHDAVYLFDPVSNRRIFVGEFLVGHAVTLGGGRSYRAGAQVLVPGGLIQNYQWQIEVNSRGDIFEGQNRDNNANSSLGAVALDLPEIVVDQPGLGGRFGYPEDGRWFKLVPAANQDVLLVFDLASGQGATEIYVGRNYLPTPQSFDFRQREWKAPDTTALVANTTTDTYYVLAYPRSLPAGASSFTLRATVVDFGVEKATPNRVGNAGLATIEIFGANLDPGTQFHLQAANGQRWTAQRVTSVDSGRVFATFQLTGFPAGSAHVVADQTGATAIGSNLVEVIQGGAGQFYTYLTGPSVIRLGRSGTWYVTYGNKGLVDVPLPLLHISVPGAQTISLFESTLNYAESFVLLALNDQSLLPTLGPGQERTVAFEVKPGPTGGNVQARVGVYPGEKLLTDASPIGWNTIPPPEGVDPALWQQYLQELTARLGPSLRDFYALLMRDLDDLAADYLGHLYVANIDGYWLFGPEPVGATFPLPDIQITDEQAAQDRAVSLHSVRLHAPAKKPADGIRKTYFVVISNSDYRKAGQNNLPGVAKDHADIKQYLKKDLRVPEDQIEELFDSLDSETDTITRQKVLDAVKKFKDKIDGDDDLVIYYSGHGGRWQDVQQGYMFLNDGTVGPVAMENAINEVGAANTYFINDSCHSGGLGGVLTPTNGTFVGISGSEWGRVSWENASGGELTTRLKKHLRNCKSLADAFAAARQEIVDAYSGKTNQVHQQRPQLHNSSNVNLGRKPWQDPSGWRQRVRNFLRENVPFGLGDSIATLLVGSIDPNDKVGPTGSGAAGYIGLRQIMPYTVYFENKTNAAAPAQEVLIIDQLDPDLDWSTFELKELGFNNQKWPVPPGLQQFTTTVSAPSDPNPVHITVRLDPDTGHVTWFMQSVDPATGQLPEDPFAGFLPPNDATHRGEGFVSYVIRAMDQLVTGVEIHNQARIIFDPTYGFNQPIDTPVVLNTIDAAPPTSAVYPLPEQSPPSFAVEWMGLDDELGSGVFTYDIYVSENGGPFLPWLTSTTDTRATFAGRNGSTYRFYSVARDFAGNVEAAPEQPDTFTAARGGPPQLEGALRDQNLIIRLSNLTPGQPYALEASATLRPGSWLTVFTLDATEPTAELLAPLDQAARFFRLRSGP